PSYCPISDLSAMAGETETVPPATNGGGVMEAGVFHEDRSGAVLTAALAGLGAAVGGGVAWGLIVKWTDYAIGFAAWGIGLGVGNRLRGGDGGRARGTRTAGQAVPAARGRARARGDFARQVPRVRLDRPGRAT